jgi:N-methylhydantoinase A
MGTLQVGPESSGADPGPACYSQGGTEPCVTDADLLLGYLDDAYFLGGEMQLDKEAAKRAIEERIAGPLGVEFTQAVWGIHDLINETMAAAAKTHIAEKGGNPKIVTVAAFGGAGPVHAYGLAKKLGAPRVIVPPNAGVGSALGFFTAPRAFDLVRSHKVGLDGADFAELEQIFQDLEAEGRRTLTLSGATEDIVFERTVDVRFVGQGSETSIEVAEKDFSTVRRADIRQRFDAVYEKLYGRTYPEAPVEFINFKVRARLPERLLQLPKIEGRDGKVEDAIKGRRQAYSSLTRSYIPFTVYDRYLLPPGAVFEGPAIVEERESTVVAGEDARLRIDEYGFVWMELAEVAP